MGSVVVALLPCDMWDLPGPEVKPMSPALAGRFLTTGPPGKSKISYFLIHLLARIYLWLQDQYLRHLCSHSQTCAVQ